MPVVAATELGAFFLIQFWTEYFGTHLPVRRIDPLALVTRTVLKNLNSRLVLSNSEVFNITPVG